MAGKLPRLSSSPVYTSDKGGPSVSAELRGSGAAWAALGDVGAELGDMAERAMLPQQNAKGAEAVTRDENGQLQVKLRTPLNRLDEAWNHGAVAAYVAQSEGDRRFTLSELANKHMDDPEMFRKAAGEYLKTQVTAAPMELKGDLNNDGQREILQFAEHLVGQKRTRDARKQLSDIKSANETDWNDAAALAHQGGLHTPDGQAIIERVKARNGQLQNPIFGLGKDEIDADFNEHVGGLEAEAVLGQAVTEAKASGVEAGQDFLDKAIWDRNLNLSPAQRETFAGRGRRLLNELEAGQRAAGVQLRQQVAGRLDDALAAAETTGEWGKVVSPREIMAAHADNPSQGMDIISKLNGASSLYSARKQVANASPADLAALDKRMKPGDPAGPRAGFDAFYDEFLSGHEGGYTPSDGNGSPANFGVNQGANPDIDVKNLTRDQAKAVLKDRYWVASGADQLPPALAAVVGDTAVNMGPERAKQMLQDSGGDPKKFLDMREQAYRDIAAKNPEKAKNLPVWLQRNADLGNFIQGSGYADQVRTYQSFQQAVQERQQALAKDPAGYVAAARPDIAAQLSGDQPGMIQKGVRASLQAQRDMGVLAPKILSDGQAKGIVESFTNPPDPKKPADHMIATIAGLEERMGSYFPTAMAELRKAGLPGEAIALAEVKDDPAVAWRMARAVNAGREVLKKAAGETTDLDKAITQGLAPFNRSLAGQNGSSQVAAQQAQAVQLYAYQLAAEGARDPAGQAVQDVIGKHYTFRDTYRVPTGVDPGAVAAGALVLRNAVPPAAIMAETSLADPRMSLETRQTMSAQILQNKGVWLTLPDESGLYLAYPQEAGFAPGRRADGKPIAYSWSQLSGAASRERDQRAIERAKAGGL